MKHVIVRNYKQYQDALTQVQFRPVLDQATGQWVGHAETDADFSGRAGFEMLSDEEFSALSSAASVPGETAVLEMGVVTMPTGVDARRSRSAISQSKGARGGAVGGGDLAAGPEVDGNGNAVLTSSDGGSAAAEGLRNVAEAAPGE